RSRSFHLGGELFQTAQHRVLQTVQTFDEGIRLLRRFIRVANFGQGFILADRQYFLCLGTELLHRRGERFFGLNCFSHSALSLTKNFRIASTRPSMSWRRASMSILRP